MADFEEAATPSISNFDTGISGQTGAFFLPEVYSKKVQNFFRKASVVEAITNSDYTGEIASFGDTVNIIKEPSITTFAYLRGENPNTNETLLTDQELTLIVDQARAFQFVVDDIETRMSHVNWKEVAASSAAYALKDNMDSNVLTYISAQASTTGPDHVIGADDATAGTLEDVDGGATEAVKLGFATGESDPLDLLSRMARLLDDQSVPEEDRWFVATPRFYEVLAESASKLLSVDYNAGQGSIRNGLVSSGLLRGFKMYKSNNTPAGSNAKICLAGHMSAVATAGTLLNTETIRDQNSFGDIVRGLHVYGRKLLRDDALVKAFWNTSTDA
jgi:hypothetical protein